MSDAHQGERIAKVMARAGLASRREAEAWIAAGRVSVNGAVIASPALNVKPSDQIAVDGTPLPQRERTRLFLYHKPRGLVTTHSDDRGRPTIFGALPKNLPRLISVGRLDLNTEGLLLLTNDGELARTLELPQTAWLRRYRVRALGSVTQEKLDTLKGGVTVDGMRYGPIDATFDSEKGANVWLTFGIREGKNREVRNVVEYLGLKVNRLLRVSFGPFELGDLERGDVSELEPEAIKQALGELAKGIDLESPLMETRHPEARPRPRAGGASKGDGPEQRGRSSFEARKERAPLDDGEKFRPRHKTKKRRRDRTSGPRPKYPKGKE
jgi:23S rRNA pseudouridine2605 synthase